MLSADNKKMLDNITALALRPQTRTSRDSVALSNPYHQTSLGRLPSHKSQKENLKQLSREIRSTFDTFKLEKKSSKQMLKYQEAVVTTKSKAANRKSNTRRNGTAKGESIIVESWRSSTTGAKTDAEVSYAKKPHGSSKVNQRVTAL